MAKVTLKKTPSGKISLTLADNRFHIIRITKLDSPFQKGSHGTCA